jgi:hypothetical protein
MSVTTLKPRSPGVYQVADDEWEVVPFHLGPTWDSDPSYDGPTTPDGFILPKYTLGWQVIKWIQRNLLADETDEDDKPLPFKLTNEQMRFLLWFYAIDEHGYFLYREVVLQRLKGWGKDPLAACIAAVEFVGPCRFAGWSTVDRPDEGIMRGEPVAKPHPRAWIQIAAVSLTQTRNTMLLFHGLFTDACKAEHSIDIGKEYIYAYHGQKQIQAVTSNPDALEGNRPTLVIKNETHHWKSNNSGIDMAAAIERNSTKAKGGAARTLSITNAYEPSVESVARSEREAYMSEKAGLSFSTGIMYDSLEAPGDARLKPKLENEEEMHIVERERIVRHYLKRILEAVRGDAWWLDIRSLTNSILDVKNPQSRSRRFWFNQVVASEDAWLDPNAVDSAISEMAKQNRARLPVADSRAVLEAGWLVAPEEPIVMFFDGSKSDDSTALVGCRLRDGYTFTIGIWQQPEQKDRAKTWLAPREQVDKRVEEAFKRFNIVAFWADPSHTKDDEDGTRYWDGHIDSWFQRFRYKLSADGKPDITRDQLDPKFWSIKGGHRKHAIMFDMAGPDQQKLFVAAAEEFVESMETVNDIEEYAPSFEIDGHPALVTHLKNAINNPGQWGTSLMKENRESKKKIDLAVCAVGARMLRRVVLNTGLEEEEVKKPGEVWGAW